MAKILIMEDVEDEAHLLAETLRRANHQCTVRGDAKTATLALESGDFDVLITDIIVRKDGRSVPEGGLMLLGRLRRMRMAGQVQTRSIAISGAILATERSLLQIAQSLGADHVLAKPADRRDILAAIDMLTEDARSPKSTV